MGLRIEVAEQQDQSADILRQTIFQLGQPMNKSVDCLVEWEVAAKDYHSSPLDGHKSLASHRWVTWQVTPRLLPYNGSGWGGRGGGIRRRILPAIRQNGAQFTTNSKSFSSQTHSIKSCADLEWLTLIKTNLTIGRIYHLSSAVDAVIPQSTTAVVSFTRVSWSLLGRALDSVRFMFGLQAARYTHWAVWPPPT